MGELKSWSWFKRDAARWAVSQSEVTSLSVKVSCQPYMQNSKNEEFIHVETSTVPQWAGQ